MPTLAASVCLAQAATIWCVTKTATSAGQRLWAQLASHLARASDALLRAYRDQNPIQSARVRTAQSFTFKYGRVEVRAKMPRGDWLWPVRRAYRRAACHWPQLTAVPGPTLHRQYGCFLGIRRTASGLRLARSTLWRAVATARATRQAASTSSDPRCTGVRDMGIIVNARAPCSHRLTVPHIVVAANAGPFFGEDKYPLTHKTYTLPSGDLADDFHVYGLIWNETTIMTYIDTEDNVVLNVDASNFWAKGGWNASTLDNPWRGGGANAPFDQVCRDPSPPPPHEYRLVLTLLCTRPPWHYSMACPRVPPGVLPHFQRRVWRHVGLLPGRCWRQALDQRGLTRRQFVLGQQRTVVAHVEGR